MKKFLLSLLAVVALGGAVLVVYPRPAVAAPFNQGVQVAQDDDDQGEDNDSQ